MKNKLLLTFSLFTSLLFFSCSPSVTREDATVVDIVKEKGSMTPDYFLVEYKSPTGEKLQAQIPYTMTPVFQVGDKMKIEFPPDDPTQVSMTDPSFGQRMNITYGMLGISAVALFGAVLALRWSRSQGTSLRVRPIFLIILAALFIVSLIGVLTGRPYDEIIPFIR